MMSLVRWLRRYFAFIVIALTYGWACVSIYRYRTKEAPPGTITLRYAHWQLEPGVRAALDELARDYQRTVNPRVRIIQNVIPESIYGQWASTQLMGGTAPDIINIWQGLPYHIWVMYLNRYFIPLTSIVNTPNPYNRGTELSNMPLRLTYHDAMRMGYVDELQDYMMLPLSQFIMRIFYNKDLLEKLTGSATPPKTYRAFLDACATIRSQTNAAGAHYIPIAASQYHYGMWDTYMSDALTYPALRKADFNRDGTVGNDETFAAFRAGLLSFKNFPPLRARFAMVRDLCDNCQPGFTGVTRDEAVFLFAQQRVVFMSTGTWDVRSLQQQAEGKYRVGIMDYPMPTPDDPVFGPHLEGPVFDRPFTGVCPAITRTCKNPDIALDFLLFAVSKLRNERFNATVGWIPAIVNTRMDDALRGFEPHMEGVYACLNFNLGGETWVKYAQLYALYKVNQISYDEFAARFEPFYKERGLRDFMELQRDWRRGMITSEQMLTGIRAQALAATGAAARSAWVKYRVMTAARQVWPEISHAEQLQLVLDGPRSGGVGPYEYSSNVLARIRARLAAHAPVEPSP